MLNGRECWDYMMHVNISRTLHVNISRTCARSCTRQLATCTVAYAMHVVVYSVHVLGTFRICRQYISGEAQCLTT
jgi:hypothetical protein